MASAPAVGKNQESGAISVSSGALSISSPEILWHGGGNAAGKPDPVFAVDMHPDGILATAGVDGSVPPNGTVRLWRVTVNSVIEAQREEHMNNFLCDLSDHPKGAVNVCRFSPNGLLLASASERQLVIYSVKRPSDWGKITEDNLKSLVDRHWYRPSLEEIRDLAWSPDSTHVVVGSIDNKAEILRLESRDSTQLSGHQNYVSSPVFLTILISTIATFSNSYQFPLCPCMYSNYYSGINRSKVSLGILSMRSFSRKVQIGLSEHTI